LYERYKQRYTQRNATFIRNVAQLLIMSNNINIFVGFCEMELGNAEEQPSKR